MTFLLYLLRPLPLTQAAAEVEKAQDKDDELATALGHPAQRDVIMVIDGVEGGKRVRPAEARRSIEDYRKIL